MKGRVKRRIWKLWMGNRKCQVAPIRSIMYEITLSTQGDDGRKYVRGKVWCRKAVAHDGKHVVEGAWRKGAESR